MDCLNNNNDTNDNNAMRASRIWRRMDCFNNNIKSNDATNYHRRRTIQSVLFQKNLQMYTQMINYKPMLKRAYLSPYQKEPIIKKWKKNIYIQLNKSVNELVWTSPTWTTDKNWYGKYKCVTKKYLSIFFFHHFDASSSTTNRRIPTIKT